MTNNTVAVEMLDSSIPIYIPIVLGISLAAILAVILFFACRYLLRERRKVKLLEELMPKMSDPRMIGIRSKDTIEFVVPTVQVSETTEESLSETDSSGSKVSDRETRIRKKTMAGFKINPDELEKNLYDNVFTKDGATSMEGTGSVGFSLQYNYHRQQLCVRLIAAADLKSYFFKGIANPYAKLSLLPDKTIKYFTRVHRKTLNPVFNELFVFPVKSFGLERRILKITMWDYDKYSRKIRLGEILYPLKDAGITRDVHCDVTTGDLWMNLENDMNQRTYGELLFSLCYNPEKATLTLTVLKARNIHIGEKEKDASFIYTKVTLYVRQKLVRTKKTSSKKKTPEVEFNSSFQIHVPQSALYEVDFLLTLSSKSGIGNKHIIGRTQVGANCTSEQGIQHWQDMLASFNSSCAQWHILTY